MHLAQVVALARVAVVPVAWVALLLLLSQSRLVRYCSFMSVAKELITEIVSRVGRAQRVGMAAGVGATWMLGAGLVAVAAQATSDGAAPALPIVLSSPVEAVAGQVVHMEVVAGEVVGSAVDPPALVAAQVRHPSAGARRMGALEAQGTAGAVWEGAAHDGMTVAVAVGYLGVVPARSQAAAVAAASFLAHLRPWPLEFTLVTGLLPSVRLFPHRITR